MVVIQIILLFLIPLSIQYLCTKFSFLRIVGAVLWCYLIGVLIGTFLKGHFNELISSKIMDVTILSSIPLLLYTTDFMAWLKSSKDTVVSFSMATVAVFISTVAAFFLFKDHVENSNIISGMLAAVYTGGTPNLNAVGMALKLPEHKFAIVNATDMLFSTIYFLSMASFAKTLFGIFLKPYAGSKDVEIPADEKITLNVKWIRVLTIIVSTLLIVAISYFILRIFDLVNPAFMIVMASSLAIFASLFRFVRVNFRGSYDIGQYLLLTFCLSMGTLTEFSDFFSGGKWMCVYIAFSLYVSLFIHLLLAKIYGIDRDTFMVTSVAAIMSPPFVGPVVSNIQNRAVLVGGVTSGIVGYAIANYFGILVGLMLLKFL